MKIISQGLSLLALFGLTACSSTHPPMKTVEYVDLERFMGDWYVIASIPTFIEKNAYNAVESYRRDGKGRIATTFTFRDGGFDGRKKDYHPIGFIIDEKSNAVWGMQFLWPIKADYRVVYLDDAYSLTVIARQKRDYVWIMARSPQVSQQEYDKVTALLKRMGYDIGLLRKVPHQWPAGSAQINTRKQ